MVSQDDSVSWVIMAGKLRLMRLLMQADVRRPKRRRKSRRSKSRKARKDVWWRDHQLGKFRNQQNPATKEELNRGSLATPQRRPPVGYPERGQLLSRSPRHLGR